MWKRACPPPPDRRQLITLDLLQGLCECFSRFCASQFEILLFLTVAVVMFFGAFRLGEVLSASRFDSSGQALHLLDVSFNAGGVALRLRISKTNQRGRGCTVQLGWSASPDLCPVRALRDYQQGVGGEGPLFRHEDGSRLTLYQFRALFARGLVELGLPQGPYGLHSFWIDAATMAVGMGLPPAVVMCIGRWCSNTFRYYVRH